MDAALADLLDRERGILAALGSRQRESLAGLLRTLVLPFDADR